jgi:Protein of unknown function (DUF1579)
MKKILLTLTGICIIAALFGQTAEGDDAQPDKKPRPDSATMMKNWTTYMTPGEKHRLMAGWEGKWTGEVTIWPAPGAPPQKSTTTAVNKMVLNGLYMESEHKGSFDGMPFLGKGTMGFDNLRGVFVSTWIDNMGSGIMYLEGVPDEMGKAISLKGRMFDPALAVMTEVRETLRLINDNSQVMEMYHTLPGEKEMKVMEIKYTRVK